MFTATKDLMLPATVTGSWPRPRWYTQNMWGRPLDTALLDVRFREKFQDAMAVVISDQERAAVVARAREILNGLERDELSPQRDVWRMRVSTGHPDQSGQRGQREQAAEGALAEQADEPVAQPRARHAEVDRQEEHGRCDEIGHDPC